MGCSGLSQLGRGILVLISEFGRMIMAYHLSIKHAAHVVCAIGFLALTSERASADPNLNCDAYAQAAIEQQSKNLQLKCGFKGPAWQLNHANHKNWCLSPGVGIMAVSQEDHRRKEALKTCQSKKMVFIPLQFKDCNKYAQNAVDQQTLNLAFQCGHKGKAWSTNFLGHRDWCALKTVTVAMVNGETKGRADVLKKCIFKK